MPAQITLLASTLDSLYRRSNAADWKLPPDAFADAVHSSVRRAFPDGEGSGRELERYLATLHLGDLALAAACAAGIDAAWDHFVGELRPVLYRAADALDPSGAARELADALYADLYGLADSNDARRSLFRYFGGRSSLATWLRAVLAQRHVDAIRARQRLDPLPDNAGEIPAAAPGQPDPDAGRLGPLVAQALQASIDALAPRDRLRVRGYYEERLTLAEIGRITGEHEATVSRHLTRARRAIRDGIERHLRDRARLSDAQVRRAVEVALEDPGALNLQQLFAPMPERKDRAPERSREEA